MKLKKMSILSILIYAGCFASMPIINDVYIKNSKDSDKEDLNKIRTQIISINKEIKTIQKSFIIIDHKNSVTKKKLSMLESRKPYFEEKIKLYTLSNENDKLGKAKADLANNKKEIKSEELYLSYMDALVDFEKYKLETKDAELSVKIAEQELEKAYIISKDKPLSDVDAKGKKKKYNKNAPTYKKLSCEIMSEHVDVDVDVCSISDHYKKRKNKLKEKNKDLEKSQKKLDKVKKKLTDSGRSID